MYTFQDILATGKAYGTGCCLILSSLCICSFVLCAGVSVAEVSVALCLSHYVPSQSVDNTILERSSTDHEGASSSHSR